MFCPLLTASRWPRFLPGDANPDTGAGKLGTRRARLAQLGSSDAGPIRGTGDAFGSGGRWQTCMYLTGAGQDLLVDCGATSLVAQKAHGLDPGVIGAVVITHLHGDHFGGLPFPILDGQFSGRTTPLLIAGPIAGSSATWPIAGVSQRATWAG